MANLVISNKKPQVNIEKLLVAQKALSKYNEPKPVFELFDYNEINGQVLISFFDTDYNDHDATVSLREIEEFASDHYSDTFDRFDNGEHTQYTDNRTVAEYVADNMRDVISDYVSEKGAELC